MKSILHPLIFCSMLIACGLVTRAADEKPIGKYDVVITGGRVVDGTGAPWFVADVGIRDGRIARVGRIAPDQGRQVIQADGLVVGSAICREITSSLKKRQNPVTNVYNVVNRLKKKIK